MSRKPDAATAITQELHRKACCDPVFAWENKQDFEFASRGLIHRPDDPAICDKVGFRSFKPYMLDPLNKIRHQERRKKFSPSSGPFGLFGGRCSD